MRVIVLGLVLGASSVLGACGGTPERATTYLDDYASHAAALEAGMRVHAGQVAAGSNVAALGPMEQAHAGDMMEHLGGMSRDVGMMGMCTDAQGGMMSTGGMSTLVAQAKAECARHEDAMMQAADASAAMMEEDAHQATMTTMMDQMMQMHDQMMGGGMMGAGSYTCPMNAP
jgi:hypothetical protein